MQAHPARDRERCPVSVLLVDDSLVFLQVAARFLKRESGVVVVGVAASGREALAQAVALCPQVVLLDLAMPGLSGLEVIPMLRASLPKTRIIALTLGEAEVYREAALAAGADEFVSKSALSGELLPAVWRVMGLSAEQA